MKFYVNSLVHFFNNIYEHIIIAHDEAYYMHNYIQEEWDKIKNSKKMTKNELALIEEYNVLLIKIENYLSELIEYCNELDKA